MPPWPSNEAENATSTTNLWFAYRLTMPVAWSYRTMGAWQPGQAEIAAAGQRGPKVRQERGRAV